MINGQIGADYDIFIGILWSRIGTPTPRFSSGTLEEFHLAHEKWQSNPSSVELMIYFKDAPVAPSQMDAGQLTQIQEFKERLPASGGLYWVFQTADDFETEVRLHLARVVQSWRGRLGEAKPQLRQAELAAADRNVVPNELNGASNTSTDDDASDLGLLDYMELVEEAATRHAAVLQRMTSAIKEIGRKTLERTAEAIGIAAQPTIASARKIFDASAHDLNEFSAAMQAEIPQMSQAHVDFLKYLSALTAASLEISESGTDKAVQILGQLDSLTEAISTTRTQMHEFRGNIASLPRMAVVFNKAKRRTLETLIVLDTAFGSAITRNNQVRGEIAELLNRREVRAFARFDRITADPNVMGGKPCIRGMRVTVGMIQGLLHVGRTEREILQAYPYLEPEDIRQAAEFGSLNSEEREASGLR